MDDPMVTATKNEHSSNCSTFRIFGARTLHIRDSHENEPPYTCDHLFRQNINTQNPRGNSTTHDAHGPMTRSPINPTSPNLHTHEHHRTHRCQNLNHSSKNQNDIFSPNSAAGTVKNVLPKNNINFFAKNHDQNAHNASRSRDYVQDYVQDASVPV